MIIKIETLMAMDKFKEMDKDILTMKLEAIEGLIRAYTNNNFQNRAMRITAPAEEGALIGYSPYFKVGDTIEVSQSAVNNGLYEIKEITGETIRLNTELYDSSCNLVTKIIYPADVQQVVIDLMQWEADNRQKVGIKQETISRHSVTYYDQDASNQVMGYPVSLLGSLKPYTKPRF